jgi:hypothetical protein
MIPDHLNTLATVCGMALLTVLTASLVSSYHKSQQQRRARIRQLMAGILRLEGLLQSLAEVSLPREARLLLRRDILARYRTLRRVHRGYPAIDSLIRQAQNRCDSEGPDAGVVLPVPPGQEVFELWIGGLREVTDIVRYGRLHEPVPVSGRNGMLQQLLERQAECLYGHHMNQADKLKQAGRTLNARSRIQGMQEQIRSLGVHSERVDELMREAEKAYQFLMYGAAAVTAAEQQPAQPVAAGG